MINLHFQNAVVSDNGNGVMVNGEYLDKIISTVLGTRIDDTKAWYGTKGVSNFSSNCCNLTVIIDPQPSYTQISDGKTDKVYKSIKELEEAKREQFKEENEETAPEE